MDQTILAPLLYFCLMLDGSPTSFWIWTRGLLADFVMVTEIILRSVEPNQLTFGRQMVHHQGVLNDYDAGSSVLHAIWAGTQYADATPVTGDWFCSTRLQEQHCSCHRGGRHHGSLPAEERSPSSPSSNRERGRYAPLKSIQLEQSVPLCHPTRRHVLVGRR